MSLYYTICWIGWRWLFAYLSSMVNQHLGSLFDFSNHLQYRLDDGCRLSHLGWTPPHSYLHRFSTIMDPVPISSGAKSWVPLRSESLYPTPPGRRHRPTRCVGSLLVVTRWCLTWLYCPRTVHTNGNGFDQKRLDTSINKRLMNIFNTIFLQHVPRNQSMPWNSSFLSNMVNFWWWLRRDPAPGGEFVGCHGPSRYAGAREGHPKH